MTLSLSSDSSVTGAVTYITGNGHTLAYDPPQRRTPT